MIVINHERYGAKTSFKDIEEAITTVRALGDGFADTIFTRQGDDIVDDRGDVVGYSQIHWKDLQNYLYDSDGCHPDNEQFIKAMDEYCNHCGIDQYWFCDVSKNPDGYRVYDAKTMTPKVSKTDTDGEPLWRDPFHNNEYRDSWDCGPDEDQVDFTGLNEQIAMLKEQS